MGFDEYNVWFASECFGNVSIPDKQQILINAYPNKKIFFIINGYKQEVSEEGMNLINLRYLELSKTTPNCLGLLVFAYNTDPVTTVVGLPIVRANLEQIGKQYINGVI